MKTVAQLGSGKKPVGTTAYMGRAEHLLQCRSDVQKGNTSNLYLLVFSLKYFSVPLMFHVDERDSLMGLVM